MIVREHVSCLLTGEVFDPEALAAATGLPLQDMRRKGDIIAQGRWKGQTAEYGQAWLHVETESGPEPLSRLLDMLAAHQDAITAHGAHLDDRLYYAVAYKEQCNLAFPPEEHRKLADLGLSLRVMFS